MRRQGHTTAATLTCFATTELLGVLTTSLMVAPNFDDQNLSKLLTSLFLLGRILQ